VSRGAIFPEAVFHEEFLQSPNIIPLHSCTQDGYMWELVGVPMISKTDLDRLNKKPQDIDTPEFANGLHTIIKSATKEFSRAQFITGIDATGFDGVGRAMDQYYKDMNIKTGVTAYVMPIQVEFTPEPDKRCTASTIQKPTL
jgi:hypothetical protein